MPITLKQRINKFFVYLTLYTASHVPRPVQSLIFFIFNATRFLARLCLEIISPRSKKIYKEMVNSLDQVETLPEWIEGAEKVDELTGADLWRRNFVSKRYDFQTILDQYMTMCEDIGETTTVDTHGSNFVDFEHLQYMFTTASALMLRNFAGISDKRLYSKSFLGTKILIEQYINKIIYILDFFEHNSEIIKTSFYHCCKLSLGTTALILQGGSLFGLYHIGVIKALFNNGLLPRIICGSSMGACVASLCCCLSAEQLDTYLNSYDFLINKIKNDTELLKECGYGDIENEIKLTQMISNIIFRGYSKDVYLMYMFIRKHVVGDMTFEESFALSGQVLNIVLHPKEKKNACPTLLNYVTTPNVLISSAIACSLSSEVVPNCKLLCKNFKGEVEDYFIDTHNIEFLTPQQHNDSMESGERNAYTRLTELFNVNNFIISLARPYLSYLVTNDIKHDIKISKYYSYKNPAGVQKPVKKDKTLPPSIKRTTDDLVNAAFSKTESANALKATTTFSDYDYDENPLLRIKMKYHFERKLKQVITMEIKHRMDVLDDFGYLNHWIKKLTIDEKTPKTATEVTIVPQMQHISIPRIIEGRLDNIKYWIDCGERSTWSVLPLVRTRCAIEFKIDEIIQKRHFEQQQKWNYGKKQETANSKSHSTPESNKSRPALAYTASSPLPSTPASSSSASSKTSVLVSPHSASVSTGSSKIAPLQTQLLNHL